MKLAIVLAGMFSSGILCGAVELPAVFSDHAVLARKEQVPVFGTAAPGEKITVSYNGRKAETTAGKDGNWRVDLNLKDAPETPFELRVNEKVIKDVVAGEVWLCSGQSNMAFTMGSEISFQKELKNLPGGRLRRFYVSAPGNTEPQKNCRGRWVYADTRSLKTFTAVGYYFARELLKNNIGPVGLIQSAQGASRIESWMSEESLKELVPDAKAQAAANKHSKKPYRIPLMMFNSRINPLIPYRLTGVIWYQGEANSKEPQKYAALFRAMILDWRKRFEDPGLPFFWCNLPAYRGRSADPAEKSFWAELRAAQTAVLDLPHTGQAVLVDTGEEADIHPRDKYPAGVRLGALALNRVYGKKIPDCGPSVEKVVREGGKLRIAFKDAYGGLKARPVPEEYDISIRKGKKGKTLRNSPNTQLEGFALCGADGVWHWADEAVVDGDTVVVSSGKVPLPAEVKYAWQNNPVCNLYNGAGFPAVPFQRKCDGMK